MNLEEIAEKFAALLGSRHPILKDKSVWEALIDTAKQLHGGATPIDFFKDYYENKQIPSQE